MGEILVVIEHREGEVREISLQMLWKGDDLCKKLSHDLTAVVVGEKDLTFPDEIAERADRVIVIEDEKLGHFNSEQYTEILTKIIDERSPFIVLMGHTPWGIDYAPSLAVRTGFPLASDCVDIVTEGGKVKVIRQVYSGKMFTKVCFKESETYLITVRAGSFPADKAGDRNGVVERSGIPLELPEVRKEFMEFEDSGAGELDITQADLLVSIGRGIGEEENIAVVKELADRLGGVVSCSRPVVDKNWLPKYHQVGTSGKSVKPKVYFALGISGAFQHIAGISGADTIIAVNKDKKAPIFRVADYGITDDLLKVVDAIKERIGN